MLATCKHDDRAPVPDAATEPEEEDPAADVDASACPRDVHPDYCRNACRSFVSRLETLHARRMKRPTRSGWGTCGAFFVFAEDELGADGAIGSSLVEYYDASSSSLVAATDSRRACGRYGQVPTCTPVITWHTRGTPRPDPLTEIMKLRARIADASR